MLYLLVIETENNKLKEGHYKSINTGLLWYMWQCSGKKIDLFTCEDVIKKLIQEYVINITTLPSMKFFHLFKTIITVDINLPRCWKPEHYYKMHQ